MGQVPGHGHAGSPATLSVPMKVTCYPGNRYSKVRSFRRRHAGEVQDRRLYATAAHAFFQHLVEGRWKRYGDPMVLMPVPGVTQLQLVTPRNRTCELCQGSSMTTTALPGRICFSHGFHGGCTPASRSGGTKGAMSPAVLASCSGWKSLDPRRGRSMTEPTVVRGGEDAVRGAGVEPDDSDWCGARYGRPNFPHGLGISRRGASRSAAVRKQALRHFMYRERPEGMEQQDAQGFVPVARARDARAGR